MFTFYTHCSIVILEMKKEGIKMELRDLFVKYNLGRYGLDFKTIYNVLKAKRYYSNKDDFEIDLERALDEGTIVCIRENNVNKFYLAELI